jgi:hypothetical protein
VVAPKSSSCLIADFSLVLSAEELLIEVFRTAEFLFCSKCRCSLKSDVVLWKASPPDVDRGSGMFALSNDIKKISQTAKDNFK